MKKTEEITKHAAKVGLIGDARLAVRDYEGAVRRIEIMMEPERREAILGDKVYVDSNFGYLVVSRGGQTVFLAAGGRWKNYRIMEETPAVAPAELLQEHAPIDPNQPT